MNSQIINPRDRNILIGVLKKADKENKELTLDEIIERVRKIRYPHSNDYEKISIILSQLSWDNKIKKHSSNRSNRSNGEDTYRLNTPQYIFPGSQSWFKTYQSYTKRSGYHLVHYLLGYSFKCPNSDENQGLEPDPEEVESILRKYISNSSDRIRFPNHLKEKYFEEELDIWIREIKTPRVQEGLAKEEKIKE